MMSSSPPSSTVRTLAIFAARFAWVTITIFMAVYIGYASIYGTNPDNVPSGGLNACFECPNGWNWHVLLSTLAFAVFMSEAIFAFIAPTKALGSRKAAFYWHFALQTGALVLVWVGLGAIVINKVKQGYLSMYSVHAWCGVIVLFFFTAQYFFGVAAFVFLKDKLGASKTLRWWHSFCGYLTFFAGIETCVNGWADMQMMQVDYGQPSYGSATMLGSASAVVYWLLAGSVAYLLIDSQAAPTGSDDGSDTAKV